MAQIKRDDSTAPEGYGQQTTQKIGELDQIVALICY